MKTLFSLRGRMKRATFIRGFLAVTAVWIAALALIACIKDKTGWTDLQVEGIVIALTLLRYVLLVRLCVPRLNDVGRSGWRCFFASRPLLYRDLFLSLSAEDR